MNLSEISTPNGTEEKQVMGPDPHGQDRATAVSHSASYGERIALVGAAIGGKRSPPKTKPSANRAPNSGISLTDTQASIIKGMLAARDADGVRVYRQSDIAAYFCCNPGRISDIMRGRIFRHVRAATDGLPPPGPYIVVNRLSHDAAVLAKNTLDKVVEEIEQVLRRARRVLDEQTTIREAL